MTNRKMTRHLRKQRLLKRRGGECQVCGYQKSPSALEFHHRDERRKCFNVSGNNLHKPWDLLVREADKCDVLCSVCHKEHHDRTGWVHENGNKTPR